MPKAHPRLFRKKDASGKETGPWYAVVYDRAGVRHRVCTKRLDTRAAESELRRLEREFAEDRPALDVPRHTVNEALDYLIKVRGKGSNHYQMREAPLREHFGAHDVNGLHVDHLYAYIAKREGTKVKNAARNIAKPTIGKELKALKTALKLAAKRGLFKGSIDAIWPEFEAPYVPRQRHLSPGQFELLAGKLPRHRLTWLVVGAFTGGRRRTEVERVTWEGVDFGEGTVHLAGTKTDAAARLIPLAEPLRVYLLRLREELGGEPRGRIVQPWRNQWRDLGAACAAVGIPRVTANDIRRTFASWMIQAGVSNSQVAKLLGHTTTTMVDRTYGKHTVPALRGAVATLPAPLLPYSPQNQGATLLDPRTPPEVQP